MRKGGARLARRHLKGKVEGRQILPRMVLRISQLRDAEIVGPRLGAFVDAGIEIDEMPAGLAVAFMISSTLPWLLEAQA